MKCEYRYIAKADCTVVLPVDIHSPTANYGTQFGICPRPTHRNTTQDQAKFECCAHGFADLSEAGYGISFLARDKFGYSIEGNVMRLSMLRGPKTPDPRADGGRHDFEFGILPHLGGYAEANVPRQALEFTTAPHSESWFQDNAWANKSQSSPLRHRTFPSLS